MKIFIRGREQLTRLAETLCYDPDLAKWLGEIFDTIGLHGYLDIRTGNHRESKWEYFKGTYWEGGLASRLMSENSQRGSSRLKNAAILLSDLEIDEPKGLAPLLEVAARHRLGRMLVVAKSISERALSLLLSPPIREKLQILVVKTPGLTIDEQWAALQDLSILTGGRRPLLQAAGDSLGSVKVEFLGQAPHVYADLDQFGIIGTSCNPDLLEQHIDHLKDKYISTEDVHTRRKLLERIGKLQGGSAVLWVGASTPIDLETRKALAEKTSEAIRWAMLKGIVPGGGAAFLDCCPAVTASLRQAKSFEESTAYRILIQALHEPMSALLSNAGISAAEVIGQVEQTGPGLGFDLIQGQVVDMIGEGIYDSAAVAKAIVCCAVRGAAQALTTQVVVHRRNPPDASITT